jgi:hypothetical protein
MKKSLILILISWAIMHGNAQNTILQGNALGAGGEVIRLLIYEDLVSYEKKLLDSDTVRPDGSFSLEAELSGTTYAIIGINFQEGEIFLVPDMTYHLEVRPVKDMDKLAYYDRPMLDYSLQKEPGEGINGLVREINEIYNDFLLSNPRLFKSPSRKTKVEEVAGTIRNVAGRSENTYLGNMSRYKIASMELFFRTKSNETLATEYLTGKSVLYGNVEYMDFFHLYFEKYLLVNNPYLPYSRTSELINDNYTLEEIVGAFMEDPVLADRRLAEMVLLDGLKEMSSASGFKKERIIELLDEMSSESEFSEHRTIAKNLKGKILWMTPGNPAPFFELEDVLGKVHTLDDYKGKYLYLSFVSLYSPSSLAEINLLADIFNEYRHHISFVSIIVDALQPGWSGYITDYRINWPLLLGYDKFTLLEEYGATAPPLFLLVDPEGKIYKYPAPSPSEDLPSLLDSLK